MEASSPRGQGPGPSTLIEAIHAKLLLTYGRRAWADLTAGLDDHAVRGTWAHELRGVRHEAVAYALSNLPPDRIPNVLQFRAICLRWQAPEQPRLPPVSSAMTEHVKQRLERARETSRRDAKQWARDLRTQEQGCERLTPAQRAMWRAAINDERSSEENRT